MNFWIAAVILFALGLMIYIVLEPQKRYDYVDGSTFAWYVRVGQNDYLRVSPFFNKKGK